MARWTGLRLLLIRSPPRLPMPSFKVGYSCWYPASEGFALAPVGRVDRPGFEPGPPWKRGAAQLQACWVAFAPAIGTQSQSPVRTVPKTLNPWVVNVEARPWTGLLRGTVDSY